MIVIKLTGDEDSASLVKQERLYLATPRNFVIF